MEKPLFSILFLFTFLAGHAQTYEVKKTFTAEERNGFLGKTKEIFNYDAQVSYNISTNDGQPSFSKMSDSPKYDQKYLDENLKALKKEPLHPIFNNNLANYYNDKGEKILAAAHYKTSLENLSLKALKKDSAYFYSFRAILKSNLGAEGSLADFERALKKNPSDSIATHFYPLFLIQSGRFDDAKKISRNALDKKGNTMPEAPFCFLMMANGFEKYQSIFSGDIDPALKEKFLKTDYDQIIDFAVLDKYAKMYEKNQAVQNLRKCSEIMAILLKFSVFDKKDNWIEFAFTASEIQKIKNLENWFTEASASKKINEYTANKSLGFINLVLNQKETAIQQYQKALEVFPKSKQNRQFNPAECYDLLITLNILLEDKANLKKAIENKIASEPEGSKSCFDHITLSRYYLLNGQIEEAEAWCKKAQAIDSKDFATFQLLSHFNFLGGRNYFCKFYGEEASKYIKSDNDYFKLNMQFVIYHILNGEADAAMQNIAIGEKLEKNSCELCDELKSKYITSK